MELIKKQTTIDFMSQRWIALGDGWVEGRDLETVRAFVQQFIARGRMPADELAETLAADPAASLDWASAT